MNHIMHFTKEQAERYFRLHRHICAEGLNNTKMKEKKDMRCFERLHFPAKNGINNDTQQNKLHVMTQLEISTYWHTEDVNTR